MSGLQGLNPDVVQKNKGVFLKFFVLFSFLIFLAAPAWAALRPDSFAVLAEKSGPAVVNIRTEKITQSGDRMFRHFFSNPFGNKDPFEEFFKQFQENMPQKDYRQRSLGSGFLISADGYIVTNNHVIDGADKIQVKMKDGEEYDAEIVGKDPNTDLALIRITAAKPFPFIRMGDSENLKVGEWVVAIGSPFGLEQTVTAGIVSAKGRVIGSGFYDDFIQTDASINPGNSGGPLINLDGEVIGINTAIIASGQGIGFAIPVNLAKGIIEQLKKDGTVSRGWLGVEIQPIDKAMAEYHGLSEAKGVYVVRAIEGDPAHAAGIRSGDVITHVNGVQVNDTRDLTFKIAATKAGENARVSVLREGKKRDFTVKVAKRSENLTQKDSGKTDGAKPSGKDDLGLSLQTIDEAMAERLGLSKKNGVIVAEVEAKSPAGKAGFRKGDIISEINHNKVNTVEEYKKALGKIKKNERLQFLIQRRGQFLVISVER